MGDDLAALNRDTEGLEPERRSLVRHSALSHWLHSLARFVASDDMGTDYKHRSGHATGAQGEEMFGSNDFAPAPPTEASEFIVRGSGRRIPTPLAALVLSDE